MQIGLYKAYRGKWVVFSKHMYHFTILYNTKQFFLFIIDEFNMKSE